MWVQEVLWGHSSWFVWQNVRARSLPHPSYLSHSLRPLTLLSCTSMSAHPSFTGLYKIWKEPGTLASILGGGGGGGGWKTGSAAEVRLAAFKTTRVAWLISPTWKRFLIPHPHISFVSCSQNDGVVGQWQSVSMRLGMSASSLLRMPHSRIKHDQVSRLQPDHVAWGAWVWGSSVQMLQHSMKQMNFRKIRRIKSVVYRDA
jgi:hypothetical protein